MSDRTGSTLDRRPTQHDRARVWQHVVAARGKGEAWRTIAERAQLSERQCRRIYRAHMRSEPTIDSDTVIDEIEDAIAFYDQAINDLAAVAERATSDWVKVKAIRARVTARTRIVELYRIAGAFDHARVVLDVRAIARAITQAFDEHDVPDEAREAVLAALGRAADAG